MPSGGGRQQTMRDVRCGSLSANGLGRGPGRTVIAPPAESRQAEMHAVTISDPQPNAR